MSFTRKIVSIINFDENTFFESEHSNELMKSYPGLGDEFCDLIFRFIVWAKTPNGKPEYCYKAHYEMPYIESIELQKTPDATVTLAF